MLLDKRWSNELLLIMQKLVIRTTPSFDRQAKKHLSIEAKEALYDYLEAQPEKGDVITGTGGVRKLRWVTGKDNKGKSGGVRVLYHYSKDVLVVLIMLYRKNELENISEAEKHELKKLIPQLLKKYKEEE